MLRILLAIFLLIPLPVLAYHVDTQAPYGTNASSNQADGTFTIGILGSDGAEDSPPENYTIFFSLSNGVDETNSFCVTTSFGHQTNTWQYYTFSLDDLKYYFKNLPALSVYYRVRANNETDNSVSTLTQQQQHGFQSGSPFDFNQEDTWTAPTGTDACNPYVVTTTTTVAPATTETAAVEEEVVEETTTTSTTLPPPPPPTTIPPEEIIVDIKVEGVDKTYTQADVNDGTVDRDKERVANQDKYGCYMTDAQIERGDCDIVEEDEKPNTETELPDDDVVVLEVDNENEDKELEPIKEEDTLKEEVKIDVKELEEEFAIEEEVIELPEIIIVEEIVEDELDKEIPGDDIIREDTVQEEDVQDQVVQEVEVPEEVIVVEEITEEQVEEVQAVVNTAIENVEELTEEQVEVVAEVLQVQTEDVEIIAEAVKTDEVVAEAVEVYVERAVENKDVENYTLADVVTEIQFEQFLENPIESFVSFDEIDLSTIGDDMTQDQKEKAQEVVVPVILTRIASMAAFIFRRS